MYGFKLDDNGDLKINGGVIENVRDEELTIQTIKTVLGTNRGEWFLNEDEGVEFSMILGKGVTEDMIRSQVEDAINQVDPTLYLDVFTVQTDKTTRETKVTFTAKRQDGTTASGERTFS